VALRFSVLAPGAAPPSLPRSERRRVVVPFMEFRSSRGLACARAIGGRASGFHDEERRQVYVRIRSATMYGRQHTVGRLYCEEHVPAKHRRLFASLVGMFSAAAASWARQASAPTGGMGR